MGDVEWETTVKPQATNAASPREGGTSEVHRPQHTQQAAASAHPQAGSDRTPPHPTPTGGTEPTNWAPAQKIGTAEVEQLLLHLSAVGLLAGRASAWFGASQSAANFINFIPISRLVVVLPQCHHPALATVSLP
jgi:hypothetical protein